ncbi:hypothetical protein RIV93_004721 [Salmonella enterica]|nr:hypothetical protein [Salmonella enterica]
MKTGIREEMEADITARRLPVSVKQLRRCLRSLTREKVVSRQGICPVVAGDVSVPVLWRRLSAEVRAWREGRPVYEMARAGLLPVRQERALAALLSGRVVIKKVQYSHRYLGLTRLGFYSGPQYQRYHSGPGV